MKEVENDLRLRHKNEIQNIFIGEIDYQEAVPSYGQSYFFIFFCFINQFINQFIS